MSAPSQSFWNQAPVFIIESLNMLTLYSIFCKKNKTTKNKVECKEPRTWGHLLRCLPMPLTGNWIRGAVATQTSVDIGWRHQSERLQECQSPK